ncbi:mechanosensitive ion channel family protein [Myroides sp. LJL115]
MNLKAFFTKLLHYEFYASQSMSITVGTILFIIVTVIVTRYALYFLRKAILKMVTPDVTARLKTVFNFVNYFIYLIMFFFILNAIGINITLILTTSAALFVGLGLALQDIFRDLIAGIYIIIDKTLNVGDVIQINNEVARVRSISLRCTIVETRNRKNIVIPNRKLIDDVVYNWTHMDPVIRAKIEVGVYIGTDPELVKAVLLSCVDSNPKVLKNPKSLVFLHDFSESTVRFYLYYFIDRAFENDRIASDIRYEIDRKFKLNNIPLPVPVIRLDNHKM